MLEQLPLFDIPAPAPPEMPVERLARSTDASSSHAAARRVTEIGKRSLQKKAVLDFLRARPRNFTSKEIAVLGKLDRHMVSRRLPELEFDGVVCRGHVRDCSITGTEMLTWRLR